MSTVFVSVVSVMLAPGGSSQPSQFTVRPRKKRRRRVAGELREMETLKH